MHNVDIKDLFNRVKAMTITGATKDKIARYLNAEFAGCYYVCKGILHGRFEENGKQRQIELV